MIAAKVAPVMTRTSAWAVAVVTVVSIGCSPSPGSSADGDASDGGDAAVDEAAPYDGPFNLPDGHPKTVQLTGCGGPGYAADFAVGSGTFQLTIDTGSGTLAVVSNSCTNCGVSKVYVPGPNAVDQEQMATDNYQQGTWTGEIYSDSVKLVGLGASQDMNFAAIDSQSGFFKDGGCAFGARPFAPQGIVGFGPPGLARPGTDAFLSKLTVMGATLDVFAVEFCSWGGQLMLGGVDPHKGQLTGPATYTPLVISRYYTASLTDMKLSGESLGFGANDFATTVVDTGTSVLALPSAVFKSLSSKIDGSAAFVKAFDGKVGWFGTTTCLSSSLTPEQIDSELPTLTLSFPGTDGGSVSLTLKATDSYLPFTTSDETYYCSGIYENTDGAEARTILGTSAMLGHVVIFDLAGGRLGFAPQDFCP
jgi:hypothetical protein